MGFKIGDIDILKEIIDLHYQLIRTQLILEKIVNLNSTLEKPDSKTIEEIGKNALKILQNKFPSMGIKRDIQIDERPRGINKMRIKGKKPTSDWWFIVGLLVLLAALLYYIFKTGKIGG